MTILHTKTIVVVSFILFTSPFFLLSAKPVLAEDCSNCVCSNDAAQGSMTKDACVKLCKDNNLTFKSCKTSAATPGTDSTTYGLSDPLGISKDKTGASGIAEVVSRLIKFLLALSGSVALLMFVWGGFQYLWSAGDENKVKSGKSTLKNAMIGLVIIFSSYMLVTTLITALSM